MTPLTATALFIVGALTASVATQEEGSTPDTYTGTYGSVTESECNVELQLLASGVARILKTCRLEDGSHRDASQSTQATWASDGTRVTVEYEDHQDVLEYDPSLSYRTFGRQGAGPGLRLSGTLVSGSRLHGFGHLWKRPLLQEETRR